MNLQLSPLDGRYANKVYDVASIFSNVNYTKLKLYVECEYLKYVISITNESNENYNNICNTINNFFDNFEKNIDNECLKIDKIEKKTNHDIQALIVYIKEEMPINIKEFVHFGLTSQDINSPATVLMYKMFNTTIFHSLIDELTNKLDSMANDKTIMLTFTHGQPATPATFSSQIDVFNNKIKTINKELQENYEYRTKMGGSNGKLTALKCVYPQHNWENLMRIFVESKLGLYRNEHTVQIDDYTNYYKLFQIYQRMCVVLINLCQDVWFYCSKRYFILKNVEGEVGSSAMPHKINPIHFENAEGNLKLTIDIFESIGRNICINRLQRDLTDSTMLRNVGVACGHMILAIRNILTGLERVKLNHSVIQKDLDDNNIVLMELIQLRLRSKGYIDAYNLCKVYSRGKQNFNIIEFIAYLKDNNIELTDDLINGLDINIEVFY